MQKASTVSPRLIDKYHAELLRTWLDRLSRESGDQADAAERKDQATRFFAALKQGVAAGQLDGIKSPEWASTRDVLDEVSRERALRGSTPAEIATFVFSLKEPLFDLLRREAGKDAEKLAGETWTASLLLDKLGLYTVEAFQKSREDMIRRQQEEMLELSTPVVQLWAGILALPLIGTLDSARTQTVMESLLQHIVASGAEIAIIDITGVPTVDTLVAQHLLKTISAARLMGADCIISGIRPQIAQTMVHLGVELDVVSKATMADALALALRRIGKTVIDRAKLERAAG
jgi:rsbT co-antagonist protein RsbR